MPHHTLEIYIQNGIRIRCTDPQTVEAMLADLKTRIRFRVNREREIESFGWQGCVYRLKNQDTIVLWWMLRWFGLREWEPYAVANRRHYYRRTVSS